MKTTYNFITKMALALLLPLAVSCNDYLEIAPTSSITADGYFNEVSHLEAYIINLYDRTENPMYGLADGKNLFHVTDFGRGGDDLYSDDQTNILVNENFLANQLTVPMGNGGYGGQGLSFVSWEFAFIYECNYFLDQVLPKYQRGELRGSDADLRQAIGEAYFFRAAGYFNKLRQFGDFPIVRHTLKNEIKELTEASVRSPRNEVARFILSDLDSAAYYMKPVAPDGGRRNRLYRDIAIFFKSRVALFEGTFLKYFKNTPFVPQGPEWPGKTKKYADYAYPTGSIDAEVNYFLDIALETSRIIADKYPLTENTGQRLTSADKVNPYATMMGGYDLSPYPECLIWRGYKSGQKGNSNMNRHYTMNNAGIGLTRSLIRSFVDKNGLPPYAPGALWGDAQENDIYQLTKERDSRAQLFIKVPGQINVYLNRGTQPASCFDDEPVPHIYIQNNAWGVYCTGYVHCKGMVPDASQNVGWIGEGTNPSFRSAEAFLTYVEACYERTGSLDDNAQRYWKAIRKRALINVENDGDYMVTVNATNMVEEGKHDWGAYSVGKLIDPMLYCIRRDRRNEFFGEGQRWIDILRWRAMDQMITTPYQQEGMKIWNSLNTALYTKEQLVYGGASATVSAPELSDFLRPHQIQKADVGYNGFTWRLAHYLKPIPIQHFRITSPTQNDAAQSVMYQNPYWSLEPGTSALQ